MVPRWSGSADSDYLPWLAGQLKQHAIELRVAPLRPEPDAPRIADSVRSLDETIRAAALHDTVLLAHSVGCQIALRWLAALPEGVHVYAFVAVAGWWTIDEPWPSIQPFLDEPFAVERARAAAGETHVFLGDDDPFTGDQQANAAAWQDRMAAHVTVVPGGKHLNLSAFDALRDRLLALAG